MTEYTEQKIELQYSRTRRLALKSSANEPGGRPFRPNNRTACEGTCCMERLVKLFTNSTKFINVLRAL